MSTRMGTLLRLFTATILVVIFLLTTSSMGACQFSPAPTPTALTGDPRFKDVTEDWSQPGLTTSKLKVVPPVMGYRNDHGDHWEELIQVQWRFADPIDLYVIRPKEVKKPPVIIYLYSYPSDTDQFKDEDFQKLATSGGFAAVGFVSALTGHRYHDRPLREWFLRDLQECLATTAHDLQMVINWIASRDDLDSSRIGVFAQGSGASIAVLASAVDPRIKVLDTLDPWGDWPTWMAKSPFVPEEERPDYVKPDFLKLIAGLDTVDWLPKVQAKSFRLQDAMFEPNTPASSKEKLRAALRPGSSLVLYKDMDEIKSIVKNRAGLDWIKRELRALPETPAPTTSSAMAVQAQ